MKKIIIPAIVALALAVITSYCVYQWLTSFILDSAIANFQVNWSYIFILFLSWLIFFSALIVLPFLWKDIIRRRKLKTESTWKVIVWMEFCCLLFSVLTTPPDLISTIMVFVVCQLIIVVNSIVLFRKLKQ